VRHDLDAILSRIADGESQAEIARSLGVAPSTLSEYLNKPEHAERSARARSLSAEAWLDRGLQALTDAPADSNEIARARAIAQECARRAAIRNPQYSERHKHEISGDGGGAVKFQLIAPWLQETIAKR